MAHNTTKQHRWTRIAASALLGCALTLGACSGEKKPAAEPGAKKAAAAATNDKAAPKADKANDKERGEPGAAKRLTSGDEVVYEKNGVKITMADLERFAMAIRTFQPPYEKGVALEARELYKQAQAAGNSRKYDKALKLFIDSSLAARHWPAPVYGAGWSYIMQGDLEKAIDAYKQADRLAPRGYKNTKLAIDTLQREIDGKLPPATYMRFELLMANTPPDKRREKLDKMLKEAPEFPGGWRVLSTMQDNDEEAMKLIELAMSYKPDPETMGHLMVNKAILLDRVGQKKEAMDILGALATNPELPFTSEYMAKLTMLRFVAEGGG